MKRAALALRRHLFALVITLGSVGGAAAQPKPVGAPQDQALPPAGVDLSIVFGGGRRGRLGDLPDQAGGSLAREVTLRRALTAAEQRLGVARVIGLDAGDTLLPDPLSRRDRGRTILRALAEAGCTIFVPGPSDLFLGVEPLSSATRIENAPRIVSASLLDALTSKHLFRPYVIEKAGGVRVAIIGLMRDGAQSELPARTAKRLRILPSLDAARNAVEAIVRGNLADVILCAGNFDADAARRLSRALPRVDALIYSAASPRPPALAMSWHFGEGRATEQPSPVLVQAPADGAALGVLRLRVTRRRTEQNAPWRLQAATLYHETIDAELPPDPATERRVEALVRARRNELHTPLVRGLSRLFGGPLDVDRFGRVLGSILREKTKTDVAIIHRRLFDEDALAQIREQDAIYGGDLERILRYDDRVVTGRIRGRDLARLFRRYGDKALLFVGLAKGPRNTTTLNGRPIVSDRWYTVVTSDFLAGTSSPYSELKGLHQKSERFEVGRNLRLVPSNDEVAEPIAIRKVIDWVLSAEAIGPYERSSRAGEEFNREQAGFARYAELADKRKPEWLLQLDNIRLTFTAVDARHDARFDAVRDKRANAQRQLAFSGAGRIRLVRESPLVTTSWRLDARYTRVKVNGEESRASEDDLRLRTDLTPVFLRFAPPLLPLDLAPSGSAEYDTEFEKPDLADAHRQQEAFITLGLKTPYRQGNVELLRVGTFASYNFTSPKQRRWKGGFEFEARYRRRLVGDWTLFTGVRARWFPYDQDPVDGDLSWFLEPQCILTLPVIYDVRFVLDASGFVFKEHATSKIGSQYAIAFGLSFSQLWRLGKDRFLPPLE